ncbi:Cof-type HAD-IIB family hydrolase [Zongyangia hominis]|uniref:Cof-type HAD-IIB family hydrolase n=1 Tax=Zongyangia hominis TaxID=2763677 RepID=A0A926E850_9FIRM|nr:Cof-type HAD-IIB family hydrolase [Zongyangia hominis]MBC8569630.1 Cof-type HAD-IIB family hydrolase [Zongyangia hominis]
MTKLSDILLVTDMDGTLMTAKAGIPKQNIEAIERFTHKGGNFAIATGRAIVSAQYYVDQLPPIGSSIVFNGGGIYDYKTGSISETSFLPIHAAQYIQELYDLFPNTGIEIYIDRDIYVPRLNSVTKQHLSNEFLTYHPLESISPMSPHTFKVMFGSEGEVMPKIMEHAFHMQVEGVYFVQTGPFYMEMLPSGVTKGTAMPKLADLYGIPMENVYAIGDYDNDVEMLQCVGHPVCPADSKPQIKEICEMQFCNCLDGAVAELISYLEDHYEA